MYFKNKKRYRKIFSISFYFRTLQLKFYMHNRSMDTYVYSIEDSANDAKTLYVNLTNKCSNACVFCIRTTTDNIKGKNMWLKNEDFSAEDVIKQFEEYKKPEEVVFCGYGEPLLKLDILKDVAKYLKEKHIKVRINTNGIANFVNKRNIVPELKEFVDEFSISLNASTKEQYNQISKPKYPEAFDEMIKFAEQSIANNIKTTLTVVDGYADYKLDLEACKSIADKIGADFKVRKWLNNGY